METTDEIRLQTYRSASEDLRDLYASEGLVKKIDYLIEKFSVLSPYKKVADVVGDTILGFYKLHEMPQLFVQKLGVSNETAQKMTTELGEFIGPVLKREEELTESKKTDLQKLAESFAEKSRIANQKKTQDVAINTTDAGTKPPYVPLTEAEKVQPMRTMEGDTNRIHGYGAYYKNTEDEAGEIHTAQGQNAILKNKDI